MDALDTAMVTGPSLTFEHHSSIVNVELTCVIKHWPRAGHSDSFTNSSLKADGRTSSFLRPDVA